jgi:hypothetical protein
MPEKIITNDGKRGGWLVGKSHREGGIEAIVTDTGKKVELENSEIIINAVSAKKHWKALSEINQDGGGVPIAPPNNIGWKHKAAKKMLFGGNIGDEYFKKFGLQKTGVGRSKELAELPTLVGTLKQEAPMPLGSEWFTNNINDIGYKWKLSTAKAYGLCNKNNVIALQDVIDHKEFFTKYPKAKNIKVFFRSIKTDDSAKCEVNHGKTYDSCTINIGLHFNFYKIHGKEKFELGKEYSEYSKEACLLHEIQHVCQQADRRSCGRSYDVILDSAIEERKIRKGEKGYNLVEAKALTDYKAQESEQEAMKCIYYWLKGIGLKYTNDIYIDWDNERAKEQEDSQKDVYGGGGKIEPPNNIGWKHKQKKHEEKEKRDVGHRHNDSELQKDGVGNKDREREKSLRIGRVQDGGRDGQGVRKGLEGKYNKNISRTKSEDGKVIAARWDKKKNKIETLTQNIQSLRYNISTSLKSEDEKEFLTALAIALIDKTGERVGNETSEAVDHRGITGLRKKHIKIEGNKVYLDYTGKSGVDHETCFTDEKLANALKQAIANSKGGFILQTSDGFRIRPNRINRELSAFGCSAKDLRGYKCNQLILAKLNNNEIGKDEKERKKHFLKSLTEVAAKIGHGRATLRKHYMIPELETSYIVQGKVIDISSKDTYEGGGVIPNEENPNNIDVFTNQIRDFLNKNATEYLISNGGRSKTDFGNSNYLYATIGTVNDSKSVKIRISDHSVTNHDRIFNEIHISFPYYKPNEKFKESDFTWLINEINFNLQRDKYFSKEDGFENYTVQMEVNEKGLRDTDKVVSERLSSAKRGAGRKIFNIERVNKKPVVRWVDKSNNKVYSTHRAFSGGGIIPNEENNQTENTGKQMYDEVFAKKDYLFDKKTFFKHKDCNMYTVDGKHWICKVNIIDSDYVTFRSNQADEYEAKKDIFEQFMEWAANKIG